MIEPESLGAAAPPRESEVIQRILAAARAYLHMEVAFVSEFHGGRSVMRFLDAAVEDTARLPALEARLLDTYCYRVVRQQFPEVIPDTLQFAAARDLRTTTELAIGSYVGVPVVLSSGETYGIFCCYGRHPDPTLSDRGIEVVRMLARVVAETLESEEALRRRDKQLRAVLERVIEGDGLDLAFQPIVDLARGLVVGYEALSRISGPPKLQAEEWFLEADRLGLGGPLEGRVISAALAAGQSRPPNTFLSINVSQNSCTAPRSSVP